MKTQLLLQIVFIALLITFNSDLKIYSEKLCIYCDKLYNKVSDFLFGGKSNICRR